MTNILNFAIRLTPIPTLEAREGIYLYQITQSDVGMKAHVKETDDLKIDLIVGDIYECLDACNSHYLSHSFDSDIAILKANGWEIECESPFEIRNVESESFASGEAAQIVLDYLKNEA